MVKNSQDLRTNQKGSNQISDADLTGWASPSCGSVRSDESEVRRELTLSFLFAALVPYLSRTLQIDQTDGSVP